MRAFWVNSMEKKKKRTKTQQPVNKQANPEEKTEEMQHEKETYTLEKPEDQVLLHHQNRARKIGKKKEDNQ